VVVKRVLQELSGRSKLSLSKVTVSSLAFQKSSTLLRLVNTTDARKADSGFSVAMIRFKVVSPALRLGVVAKAGAHTAVGQTVIVPSSFAMLDPLLPDINVVWLVF